MWVVVMWGSEKIWVVIGAGCGEAAMGWERGQRCRPSSTRFSRAGAVSAVAVAVAVVVVSAVAGRKVPTVGLHAHATAAFKTRTRLAPAQALGPRLTAARNQAQRSA